MDESVTVLTNPTVSVRLTSTISSFEANRRFNRGITVTEFKVVKHHDAVNLKKVRMLLWSTGDRQVFNEMFYKWLK